MRIRMTQAAGLRACRAFAALLALAAAAPCGAALTHYTTRAGFDAAVGPHEIVTFTDLAAGTVLSNQYASRGLSFPDGTDRLVDEPGFSDHRGVVGDVRPGPAAIDAHFATPQSAVGVDYPGSITIDLYRAGVLIGTSDKFGNTGGPFFGGVVSSVPFDRAVFRDTVDEYPFVDNVHFSQVPEPASGLVLLGALGVLAASRSTRGAASLRQ